MKESDLSKRMRKLAETHERADELIKLADEFDKVTGTLGDPDVHFNSGNMLAVWARARKLWCACSGEPIP